MGPSPEPTTEEPLQGPAHSARGHSSGEEGPVHGTLYPEGCLGPQRIYVESLKFRSCIWGFKGFVLHGVGGRRRLMSRA